MRDDSGNPLKGMALMAVSLALVLAANTLARDLAARYPAGEVLFLRFLVSLAVILPLALRGGTAALRTRHPFLQAGRAACGIGAAGIFYAATQHLPFGELVALSYMAPLFVALLSPVLLGERVGRGLLASLLLGFGGVVLVAIPNQIGPNQIGIWSVAALAMALLNALCAVGARHLGRADGVAATTALFALAGTLMALPVAALDFVLPSAADLPRIAALGLFAGLAVHVNALALRAARAAVVAPVDYLGIAASAGIGWTLWGEEATPLALAGGALIAASGLLSVRDASLGRKKDVRCAPALMPVTGTPRSGF